ncbi:MAG TPA: SdrD B-like domain-containing protein [Candidatus Krumholzibacteria bacterium]|nr:SdrD B-like domain-containing protein [Candidatus Krumholzibacteria bacterium]HPD73491.1 SdrD B-like domain-containing protein [Candidatus Krumholzibacteria bacterium]HRY42214.1 SdrD B-like domain-containing protein [Candidatus Krumholzibacteria bacterium]
MADLGLVGRTRRFRKSTPFPPYATASISTRLNADGNLGGTISESGNPINGVVVFLHWRQTMQVIAKTYTDANGEYSFSGLDPAMSEKYVVVIQDRPGGTVYNDAIYALASAT